MATASNHTADVIVVGLGAHGSAAAAALARRGVSVLGFDMFTPPHAEGSAHGGTRIIREVYSEHPDYVPMVQHAIALWRRLQDESEDGTELIVNTGGISIGRPEATFIKGVQLSAEVHDLEIETLDPDEIHRRWPQLVPRDDMIGLYDSRAGALFPERGVQAHLDAAKRFGAQLHYDTAIRRWHHEGDGIKVYTDNDEYHAGTIIFAAGAWNRPFLSKLNLPLKNERQVLVWFEPSASPELFQPDRFPNASWEWSPDHVLYSQANFGDGVKVAFNHDGDIIDGPDELDREVRPSDTGDLTAAVSDIMPKLPGRVIDARVCIYTNTPDHHFLIDRHPGHSNVVISSACSGHGYKFSPAIGEALADLATGTSPAYDISRFAIDRLLNGGSQTSCPEDGDAKS